MAARAPDNDASMGDLIHTVIAEASRLARQEVQLAIAESKAKARGFAGGAVLCLVAFMLALGAFGAVTIAAIGALALIVPVWLAALIVTITYAVASSLAVASGISALRKAGSPVPSETLETLKDEVLALRSAVTHARRTAA